MADRIIKPDSGNDVVIQNNGGTRKVEVTNSGDVEITGDVKTTTVKATNLKANDGTAGLEVADSTGEVTSSGGLKATNVKTTNLKANDGTASLVIADSTGEVTSSGGLKATNVKTTNLKANDGTDALGISDSSGLVSLSNGINGVRTNQAVSTSEIALDSNFQTIVSTTLTPKSSSSKLLVLGSFACFSSNSGSAVNLRISLSATGHTTSYSDTQGYISYQASSDTQIMAYAPINYIFTVSNTNTYTITLEAQKQSGTVTANYDDGGGDQKSTLQVLEI